MSEKSPWEVLSQIDVSKHIEKKNGLSYLSWAWAWGVLKKHYPHAWFRKHENLKDGMPYFHDANGFAFVRVTVGLDATTDYEVTEFLPVLDHRNRPIQNPDAFSVNNALQRCLTKAIGYHGLGHYIYAGEDLPDQDDGTAAQRPGGAASAAGGSGTGQKKASGSTGAPSGPEVPQVSTDGAAPETVAEVFLQFIPTCADVKTLNGFYTKNKSAMEYLEATSSDLHGKVMAAFKDQKQNLKG